ncbi:GGDEF domain-containing protein [Rhodanobacter sp. L36]|uniref:GGDEF domain-containing protein n=1 Tax=Rhodanobacter sp. L36 TaxID=1747221 RepID=UPI00131C9CB5|nr:GGDEF domain-containing protein [Rhodanobacter sp. L36]
MALCDTATKPKVADLLVQADNSKTSDHDRFLRLLNELHADSADLSTEQKFYLDYLQAWQNGYQGDYQASTSLIDALIENSGDTILRFRGGLLLVNTLAERSRFDEAFKQLNLLLGELPEISDPDVRAQAFTTAAYLYGEAGQYGLASSYADKLLKDHPAADEISCKITFVKLGALYRDGKFAGIGQQFQNGIDLCLKVGDTLYANGIRFFVASLDVQQKKSGQAIQLLTDHDAEVRRSGYQWQISQFDALLSKAYLDTGHIEQARESALRVIAQSVQDQYAESLSMAYQVLYMIEKGDGNPAAALAYHEQYMKASQRYQDALSSRVLAYQIVQQELLSKKLQIDTLSKQNQILQLQQAFGRKKGEASRLYIVLLLMVVAFIAFWAYRIKRSQLRFMGLARRDGLTGIFNRQHFVTASEQQLQACRKSAREVCLVLIDLDHFKSINDTHGHSVGDRVLRRTVATCQAHLRTSDIFGRLGGEEFGIVLPDCPLEKALGRVELMRLAIASVTADDDVSGICISASFGVASSSNSGYELRQLLIHADEALYGAKRDGRNRVNVSLATHQPSRAV